MRSPQVLPTHKTSANSTALDEGHAGMVAPDGTRRLKQENFPAMPDSNATSFRAYLGKAVCRCNSILNDKERGPSGDGLGPDASNARLGRRLLLLALLPRVGGGPHRLLQPGA